VQKNHALILFICNWIAIRF